MNGKTKKIKNDIDKDAFPKQISITEDIYFAVVFNQSKTLRDIVSMISDYEGAELFFTFDDDGILFKFVDFNCFILTIFIPKSFFDKYLYKKVLNTICRVDLNAAMFKQNLSCFNSSRKLVMEISSDVVFLAGYPSANTMDVFKNTITRYEVDREDIEIPEDFYNNGYSNITICINSWLTMCKCFDHMKADTVEIIEDKETVEMKSNDGNSARMGQSLLNEAIIKRINKNRIEKEEEEEEEICATIQLKKIYTTNSMYKQLEEDTTIEVNIGHDDKKKEPVMIEYLIEKEIKVKMLIGQKIGGEEEVQVQNKDKEKRQNKKRKK